MNGPVFDLDAPYEIFPEYEITDCGFGEGMAYSADVGMLATCNIFNNTVSVHRFSVHGSHAPELLHTYGGLHASSPMKFSFGSFGFEEGRLAFTTAIADQPSLLLVCSPGQQSVHIVDVVTGTHMGFVNGTSCIASPHQIAATATRVAVLCREKTAMNPDIMLYHGCGSQWDLQAIVRMRVESFLFNPCVGFSEDGLALAVVSHENFWSMYDSNTLKVLPRVDHFDLSCNDYVRDIKPIRGGWLIRIHAMISSNMGFYGRVHGRDRSTFLLDMFDGGCVCAVVSGLGVFCRTSTGRIQFMTSTDMASMIRMSRNRLAWMSAVRRACTHVVDA